VTYAKANFSDLHKRMRTDVERIAATDELIEAYRRLRHWTRVARKFRVNIRTLRRWVRRYPRLRGAKS
jgi:hypothetical protein